MKTLFLVILATLVAVPAFAAKKKTPYEAMKADAQDAVSAFQDQQDVCDVRFQETRDGFTISVKEGHKPVVYVDVAEDSTIKRTGSEDADGSFSHKFAVKGDGTLEVVHMDDAYYHMYASKNGVTANCELDF